jgi:RNA polymerase sigma factor (sigma-70 family)
MARIDWGLELVKEHQPAGARAPTEQDLFCRRFVEGDSGATAHVVAVARRVVNDRGYYIPARDRQDIVQEILLHTYRAVARPGFVLTQDFDAFVRSISYRRCVDWMRGQRSVEPLDPQMADASRRPDQQMLSKEMIQLGRQIVLRLSESCRELIRMRGREGLSYRQIAQRQERTEGSVRNQMSRCLARARQVLEEIEPRQGDVSAALESNS